ncbi:MAG TPA: threonine synthase [Actinomycetota bacterium]|nr:threonine synthase [Actinomycetota bacterium]
MPSRSRLSASYSAISRLDHLECARCGRDHDGDVLQNRCACGGTLLARYDLTPFELSDVRARPPGMWRYRELLPVRGEPVSLGEGPTPLLPAPRLSERFEVEVFVKDDGPLPSGTFKARGAAAGLSRAAELGADAVVMPSAGNAGAAWSLYAARAGVSMTVTMARSAPEANKDEVRLAGAELVEVDGTLADAAARARELSAETGAFLASTFAEPYRVEGKKSAWLECFDQLGRLPGTVVTSVGGGVAAVACAKAVEEVTALGWFDSDGPAIVGVQADGCAPIVRAFEAGADRAEPWSEVHTIAAGLRVPAPSEADLVLDVVRASGARMVAVSDDDIRRSVAELASLEGILVCPEGATTVAGLAAIATEASLRGPVVLYNTGAAGKYLDALTR